MASYQETSSSRQCQRQVYHVNILMYLTAFIMIENKCWGMWMSSVFYIMIGQKQGYA